MSRTVLSINENQHMNCILQTVLSRKYKMIAVTDVLEGMRQLKYNEAIELIIIDLDFETEENWAFIKHIKSSWLYNRPVIGLTSNKTLVAEKIDIPSQIDYFFQKPFSPVDLIKTIDALLYTSPVYSV